MTYDRPAFLNALRGSLGLSDAAVRLALVLDGYADARGRCWPFQSRLGRDLEWSTRKVKRAMSELRTFGVVVYEQRARNEHERSVIRLVPAGDKSGTGANGDTRGGDRDGPLVVTDLTVGGDTDGPQNQPMNQPREPTHLPARGGDTDDTTSPPTEGSEGWDDFVAYQIPILEKLPGQGEQLHGESQAEKVAFRTAVHAAMTAGVPARSLARSVTAKPLDGSRSYCRVLAGRITEAIPALAGKVETDAIGTYGTPRYLGPVRPPEGDVDYRVGWDTGGAA